MRRRRRLGQFTLLLGLTFVGSALASLAMGPNVQWREIPFMVFAALGWFLAVVLAGELLAWINHWLDETHERAAHGPNETGGDA